MPLSTKQKVAIGTIVAVASVAYAGYRIAKYEKAEEQAKASRALISEQREEYLSDIKAAWGPLAEILNALADNGKLPAASAVDATSTVAGSSLDEGAEKVVNKVIDANKQRVKVSVGDQAVSMVEPIEGLSSVSLSDQLILAGAHGLNLADLANKLQDFMKSGDDYAHAGTNINARVAAAAKMKADTLGILMSILAQARKAQAAEGVANDSGLTQKCFVAMTGIGADILNYYGVILEPLIKSGILLNALDGLNATQDQIDKRMDPLLAYDQKQQSALFAKLIAQLHDDFGVDSNRLLSKAVVNSPSPKQQFRLASAYEMMNSAEPILEDSSGIANINPAFTNALECSNNELREASRTLNPEALTAAFNCNKANGSYIPVLLDRSSNQSSAHSKPDTKSYTDSSGCDFWRDPDTLALIGLWGGCHVINGSGSALALAEPGDIDMRVDYAGLPEIGNNGDACTANMNSCLFTQYLTKVSHNRWESHSGSNISAGDIEHCAIEIQGRQMKIDYEAQGPDESGAVTLVAMKNIDYVCKRGTQTECSPACFSAKTHAPIPKQAACPDTPPHF